MTNYTTSHIVARFASRPIIRSYPLSSEAYRYLKVMRETYERREAMQMSEGHALDRILRDHARLTQGRALSA
ncbi:hypothetical protein SRS16CHR_03596 [Variovorax sp. SRS16]|uniref:hypothetical protein n=1 Tax=Variovorax sp. SRS16 TaxID=282217 RepID=UPI001318B7F4|nr:hypothetical protein [Variovorax sp. SRS16]VTU25119.1 hypothetical protein SRS16CHR_03596 [Variovorax sp. SRS16]